MIDVGRSSRAVLLSACLTQGCFSLENAPDAEPSTSNVCSSQSDCERGLCWASACSVRRTQFVALLLELTPPTTLDRFQDARTYYPLLLDANGPSDESLTIKYPRTVRGDINMSFGAPDCRPSPVVVSFVPVEAHLGLDTPRYTTLSEVGTAIVDKKHVDTHRYSISGIPEGTYDVYLEDANLVDNTDRPECAVAPQSIRSLEIFSEEGASKYVRSITQAQARTLRVVVPRSSPFAGWEVDVVHPITRERLSSRATLPAASDEDTPVSVALRVSRVMGKDIVGENQELLRFSPPSSLSAPTVTMVLAGLEVFEPGEALVPALGELPDPVDYQAWVWRSPNGGKVDGSVQFTATRLDAIPAGINTTFERRATIGDSGLLEVQLPPGRYTARVVPSPSSNLAQLETDVTVWLPPSDSKSTVQGGHVIVVSQASTLSGQVRFDRRVPPSGTQVFASGIDRWPNLLQTPSRALPGARGLVTGDEFALIGLTCRDCEAGGRGGIYNLFVRPSELSGIPWAVSVGERVTGTEVTVPEVTLDLPRVVSGSLWAQSTGGPVALARFSVRAFALIGKDGEPLQAVDLPRCNQLPPAEMEALPNCAAQVLEIASTRTNDDGSFRLLLPQQLLVREFADGGL